MNTQIESLQHMLYGEGEPFAGGCEEDELETVWAKARALNPYKPIRAVKDWQWWDVPGVTIAEARRHGIIPAVIFSHSVVRDSSGRFKPGDWVRTTPLVAVYADGIVESGNTLYILVGSGTRKTVAAGLINALG